MEMYSKDFAPRIDAALCVGCGQCVQACHALHRPPLMDTVRGIAVSCAQARVYAGSASGGAFAM